VRVILFDFDGVIVNPMSPGLYQGLAKISGVPWQTINRYSLPYWLKARVATGDEEEYWRALGRICRMDSSEVKDFAYSFFHPTPGIRELIQEIHGTYQVALLSNHLEQWFKHIFATTESAALFDFIFTSFGERMAKPDQRLFQRVIEVMKVRPEECLFIDDIQRNVRSAAKFGMKTVHFTGVEVLRRELSRLLAGEVKHNY
jgi:epoxide hydrolase-like predicted phosphatase